MADDLERRVSRLEGLLDENGILIRRREFDYSMKDLQGEIRSVRQAAEAAQAETHAIRTEARQAAEAAQAEQRRTRRALLMMVLTAIVSSLGAILVAFVVAATVGR